MKRQYVAIVAISIALVGSCSLETETVAETNVATCKRVVTYIFDCVENTTPEALEIALTACDDVLETSECDLSAYARCVTAVPCDNFFGLQNTPCVDLAPSMECRGLDSTGIDD